MWLMRGLVPDHNTIANFRKDNPKVIRSVLRSTVNLAKSFDLIGGTLVAGESTTLRDKTPKRTISIQRKLSVILRTLMLN